MITLRAIITGNSNKYGHLIKHVFYECQLNEVYKRSALWISPDCQLADKFISYHDSSLGSFFYPERSVIPKTKDNLKLDKW